MIQVKDKLKDDYKGRLTYAVDKMCPCRPCYNAHDCGYSAGGTGKWVIRMYCATNYNKGCPIPRPKPIHIVKSKAEIKKSDIRKCLRCGKKVVLGEVDFMTFEIYLAENKEQPK